MKLLLPLVVTLLLVVFNSSVMAKNGLVSLEHNLPEYSKIYDDQRSPFTDAADALALAKATNRQVLIEIGGNWCSWCHKMDTFLSNNPDVYQTLHSNYVLLKINVSDSNENADFMASLPPVLGYPHMYVSNAHGKMLLSKDTAELLAGADYSKEYWLTFLNQWSIDNYLVTEQAMLTLQETGEK
ncbi:thioredoxin family protein [Colwellia sp. E150_009]